MGAATGEARELTHARSPDGWWMSRWGPTAPDGLTDNWIPTAPKDFWLIAPFDGPDKILFQKTWVMPDVEKGERSEMTKAKMATDIPAAITMPDSVEARLGTPRFADPARLKKSGNARSRWRFVD